VVASYVRLGHCYPIPASEEDEYNGQPLKAGFESHYVEVCRHRGAYHMVTPDEKNNSNKRIYEEYIVKQSSQVLPRYIIALRRVEKVFIWRDLQVRGKGGWVCVCGCWHVLL